MPRNAAPLSGIMARVPDYYEQKNSAEKQAGRKLTNAEFEQDYLVGGGIGMDSTNSTLNDTGTSIFDPALCELNYLWFTAEGDTVLDPFAGGSVRGIVADQLGRVYTGIELRQEQVDANIAQGKEICDVCPTWICGDSLNVDEYVGDAMFDHILTCPPYGNLEEYSDDPNDLSAMADDDFDATYTEILKRTAAHLKDDRFATIVVGNYRDKKGMLRDLVGLTVCAMEEAGCHYYNDFILVTPVGSLPIRVGRQFNAGRKMGRTHQYVLNFVKGNPKIATERLGEIYVDWMEGEDEQL